MSTITFSGHSTMESQFGKEIVYDASLRISVLVPWSTTVPNQRAGCPVLLWLPVLRDRAPVYAPPASRSASSAKAHSEREGFPTPSHMGRASPSCRLADRRCPD